MHVLLLIVYALLNRARGGAWLPKTICYMLFGVLACVTAFIDGLSGDTWFWIVLWLIAFGGSFFGFAHCWGKYFPNPTPTYDDVCVRIVNVLTTAVYGPYDASTPPDRAVNWKTIGMSWRWVIFFSPKYALLAGFHYYYGASADAMLQAFLICLLLLATAGLWYRLGYVIGSSVPALAAYTILIAELCTGAFVIGVADWVVLS